MTTLYELTDEMEELLDMLCDDEVDLQTVLDTMAAVNMEIEDKADAYAKIITELTYAANNRKEEAKRLSQTAKAMSDRADWLKDTLRFNLESIGKTKFKTALFSYSVCNAGGKLPLTIDKDVAEIPEQYLIPQPPIVNTEAVRKALDSETPEAMAFAHYEPRSRYLRIK